MWIKCSDKLPEERDGFFVVTNGYKLFIATYGEGRWSYEDEGWILDDVTHWMPLPELPKEE